MTLLAVDVARGIQPYAAAKDVFRRVAVVNGKSDAQSDDKEQVLNLNLFSKPRKTGTYVCALKPLPRTALFCTKVYKYP